MPEPDSDSDGSSASEVTSLPLSLSLSFSLCLAPSLSLTVCVNVCACVYVCGSGLPSKLISINGFVLVPAEISVWCSNLIDHNPQEVGESKRPKCVCVCVCVCVCMNIGVWGVHPSLSWYSSPWLYVGGGNHRSVRVWGWNCVFETARRAERSTCWPVLYTLGWSTERLYKENTTLCLWSLHTHTHTHTHRPGIWPAREQRSDTVPEMICHFSVPPVMCYVAVKTLQVSSFWYDTPPRVIHANLNARCGGDSRHVTWLKSEWIQLTWHPAGTRQASRKLTHWD